MNDDNGGGADDERCRVEQAIHRPVNQSKKTEFAPPLNQVQPSTHSNRASNRKQRRVSWIIYLTDPDEPWAAEDGGALELYPLVDGETREGGV